MSVIAPVDSVALPATKGEVGLDPVGSPAVVETIDAYQQTQEFEYRAEADLMAQQDMAFWAMLMFFASLVTIAITAIGVWLVKRTLDATLKAVEDTSVATAAMREANEIARASLSESRRIGEAQAKAYLNISLGGLNFNPLHERGKITGRATNTGVTPAVEFEISAKGTIYCDGNAVQDLVIRNHEIYDWTSVGGQTHQVITLETPPLTDSLRQLGLEERLDVWIETNFAFTDAFGARIEDQKFFRGRSCAMNQVNDVWFTFESKVGSQPARHPEFDGSHRDLN